MVFTNYSVLRKDGLILPLTLKICGPVWLFILGAKL